MKRLSNGVDAVRVEAVAREGHPEEEDIEDEGERTAGGQDSRGEGGYPAFGCAWEGGGAREGRLGVKARGQKMQRPSTTYIVHVQRSVQIT